MTDAPREIWNTVDGAEIKYIRADIAQEYLMQALAADGQAQEAYEKMQAEYKRGLEDAIIAIAETEKLDAVAFMDIAAGIRAKIQEKDDG